MDNVGVDPSTGELNTLTDPDLTDVREKTYTLVF